MYRIFAHSGELFILTLLSSVLYPLKIICKIFIWLFEQINRGSSSSRFFQSHILFYPFLWLHNHLLRYLNDQVIALFPYSSSFSQQIRLYYLVEQAIHPYSK